MSKTVWHSGPPPSIGWWPANRGEQTGEYRWWNGEADPMYAQAVEVVRAQKKASISLVQRHLKIGYNRAARLVEDMEKAGVVSAMNASGSRKVMAT